MADKSDPGFLSNAWESLQNVYRGVRDIPETAVNAIGSLGAAQTEQYAKLGIPMPGGPDYRNWQQQQAAKVIPTAKAVAQNEVQRWSHPWHTLYTDPFGAALEVAPLLGGGAGLLERALPESAGASRVASAMRLASNIGNLPISAPIKAVTKLVPKAVLGVTKGSGAIADAIQKSGVSPEVFDHPGVAAHLDNLVAQKGSSPGVAREAVLRNAGLSDAETPIMRGMTTGELPVDAAKGEIAQNAYGKAREAVAAKTASLAPDVAPDAVGSDFINSYLDGKNQVARAYHQPYSNSGTFSSDSIPSLRDHIETVLQSPENSILPDSIEEFAPHSDPKLGALPNSSSFLLSTKNSPSLFDNMQDMADQGKLSMNNVELFRRGINRSMNLSDPTDSAAHRAIRDGMDSWVYHTAPDPAMFSGDGQAVVDEMTNARQTFQDFTNTFEKNPNPNIRDATKRIAPLVDVVDDDGADGAVARLRQTAPANLPSDVQNVLLDGVYDAPTGSRPGGPRAAKGTKSSGVSTFQDLHADPTKTGMTPLTQQGQQALQDTIRSRVYGSNPSSADLANITSGPYGHLFDDSAKADLGVQAAANDILNERPTTPSSLEGGSNWPKRFSAPVIGATVGNILGNAASHVPIVGPIAHPLMEGAGAALGSALEGRLEGAQSASRLATEMSGAPKTYNTLPVDKAALVANVGQRLVNDVSDAKAPPPSSDNPNQEGFEGPALTADQALSKKPNDATPAPDDFSGPSVSPDSLFPTPHASGGRAGYKAGGHIHKKGVEHLVKRLMDKAEKAKRLNNKATEPLLKLHDNTVAKALAIAQKSI